MCRPVTCKSCGKTTWAGCGQHIDAVKAKVPASQWCGHDQSKVAGNQSSGGGLFKSLFGGR